MTHAAVAQLEERPPCKGKVGGSNPTGGTNHFQTRGGAEVARRAHKPEVAGSNPARATTCLVSGGVDPRGLLASRAASHETNYAGELCGAEQPAKPDSETPHQFARWQAALSQLPAMRGLFIPRLMPGFASTLKGGGIFSQGDP